MFDKKKAVKIQTIQYYNDIDGKLLNHLTSLILTKNEQIVVRILKNCLFNGLQVL